jgi:hypothetical protein
VEPLPLGDTAASQTMTYPRKLLVILSTVFGPKWPEVCRLTRHTERSYRVSIVAAFSISGMDFFEVELTLWEYTD